MGGAFDILGVCGGRGGGGWSYPILGKKELALKPRKGFLALKFKKKYSLKKMREFLVLLEKKIRK